MTNAELAWEIFNGAGSAAGFWSTGYVLWDRFWRHVPQAIVVPRPLMEGSRQMTTKLAVSHLARRPILVSWQNAAGEMRIAVDNSLHSVIATQWPKRNVIALDVGATRELELLPPSNNSSLPPHAPFEVKLAWKFAQPIVWQPERVIRVWLRKSDVQDLVGDADDFDE